MKSNLRKYTAGFLSLILALSSISFSVSADSKVTSDYSSLINTNDDVPSGSGIDRENSQNANLADGEYSVPISINYAMEGYEDYPTAKGNALLSTPANLKVENGNMTLIIPTKADGNDYVTGIGYKDNKTDESYKEATLNDNDGDGNADEAVITEAYSEDYIYINLGYTSASADYECLINIDFAGAELKQPVDTGVNLADGEYSVPISINYAMEGYEDYPTAKGNALLSTPANLKVENGNMTLIIPTKADGNDYVTGIGYKDNKADESYKEATLNDNDGDGNADEVVITKAYSEDYIYINLGYTSASADYECLINIDFEGAKPISLPDDKPDPDNFKATHTIKLDLDDRGISDIVTGADDKGWTTGLILRAESYKNEAKLVFADGKYTLAFQFEDYDKNTMNGEMSEFYVYNQETKESTKVTPVVETVGKGKYLKTIYLPLENLSDEIYIYCTYNVETYIEGLGDFSFSAYTGAIISLDENYLIDLSESAMPEDGNYLIDIKDEIIPENCKWLDKYDSIPVYVKDGKATIVLESGKHLEKTNWGAYYEIYGADTYDTRIKATTVPVQGRKADYIFVETSDLRKNIIVHLSKGATNVGWDQELKFELSSLKKNEDPVNYEFLSSGNYMADVEILCEDNDSVSELTSYFNTTAVPIKSENGKLTVTLYMTKEGLDNFKQSIYGEYIDLNVTPISDTGLNMVDFILYYNADEAVLRTNENNNEKDFRVKLKTETIKKIESSQLLPDGNYTVDIDLLKETSNDQSMSAHYFYSEDIPVEVKNGKIYMTINVKTSTDDGGMTDLIQGVEYQKNGKFIDAKPVNVENPADGIDQVTCTIPLESLENPTYVRIKVSAMGSWATLRIVPKLETIKGANLTNQIAVPEINTNPSTYTGIFKNNEKITITINTNEENGEIYYTLDGSTPEVGTARTFKYTRPFVVSSGGDEANIVTVKAITYKDGNKSFTKSTDVIFLEKETEVPITSTEPGVYSVPYRIWKAFENDYSMADDAVDGNMIIQISENENGEKNATYYMSLKARNQNNIIGHLLQLWNIEGVEPPTGAPSDYELDKQKAAVLTVVNEEGLDGVKDYPKMVSFTRSSAGEEYFYIRVDVDAMGDTHQSAKVVLDWENAKKTALPDGKYSVDYNIMKAFENDYSMANDAVNGPATIEINNGNVKYTLNVKARNQNNIIGHLLQLWNIPGVEPPTGKPSDYEIDANKAKVNAYINEVGLDGTNKDYPSIYEFSRNTSGEDYFYVRVDVDAMGADHQSAKFVPDWSTAKWIGKSNIDTNVNESTETTTEISTDTSVETSTELSTEPVTKPNGGNSSEDTHDKLEDGKYWMEINLWNAYADQASMGNAAFENNRKALVTISGNTATIEIGTNPVAVSGYTSALQDIRSDNISINVDSRESFTTNTRFDGNEHTFDYITKFSFNLDDITAEYIPVEISVPYTPMDGISANVGGYIAARLKLDWSSLEKADAGETLNPDSSSAAGTSSSGGGGSSVNTSNKDTGIKIEAEEFVFPDNTTFTTKAVTTGTEYDTAKKLVGDNFRLFSISAENYGEAVIPNGVANVYFPVKKEDGKNIAIYRIVEGDKNTEAGKTELEYTLSDDGKYYVVTVKEFGLFAVVNTDYNAIDAISTMKPVDENIDSREIAFKDIDNHWAKDYILKAVDKGLFTGVEVDTFAPDMDTTRAMFVTVIGRLKGISEDNKGDITFKDVNEDDYFYPFVVWASENDVVAGLSEDTFAPGLNITREQMAAILYRFAQSEGIELNSIAKTDFNDADNISSWAQESVDALSKAGIINGRTDGSFDPKGNATRAEIATMLMNFINEYMPEA